VLYRIQKQGEIIQLKESLKEFFSAYATPDGNIHNVRKGSLVYWHEYAHSLQYKNMILAYSFNTGTIILFAYFGYLINSWKPAAFLAIIPIAMELHAWLYAIKKRYF
jgi:hypothetical protein